MAAGVQSQFSRLPKKGLLFISEKLINEDFPIGNPYNNFDEAFNILVLSQLKKMLNFFQSFY